MLFLGDASIAKIKSHCLKTTSLNSEAQLKSWIEKKTVIIKIREKNRK